MNHNTRISAAVLEFEEAHFITSDKMYVEDGNEGLVRCGAQGSPKPQVQWVGLDRKYANTGFTSEGTAGS